MYRSAARSGCHLLKEKPESLDPKMILAKAGKGRSIIKYRKNKIIFSQGDPTEAVFYIQKGKLKVAVVSDRGKEAVAAILGPDEFFGEACIAGQVLRLATVSAMTESTLVRIEKDAMVRLLREHEEFSKMFTTHI